MALAQQELEENDPKGIYNKPREDKVTNADHYDKVYVESIKLHQNMSINGNTIDFEGPTPLL
jgi:adenylylsulfate kinase-like enzyme